MTAATENMVLEMIRGGPSTSGGRRNQLFAGRLMGTDSAGGTLQNVRTREKLKSNDSCAENRFIGIIRT